MVIGSCSNELRPSDRLRRSKDIGFSLASGLKRWAVREDDLLEYDKIIVYNVYMVIIDSSRLLIWSKTEET